MRVSEIGVRTMITLEVNGKTLKIDTEGDVPALWVLREELGLTGTKYGCGTAACGACTILVNNEAVRSCVTPIAALADKKVTTIEGLSQIPTGKALQSAWIEHDVSQCGYCQSGQLMTATALLLSNKNPTADIIEKAHIGNICRCGTYSRIKKAVLEVAKK
jgi:isoquinoline 1-oxidoreductase alpha subunit